jgi:hypothetical protein
LALLCISALRVLVDSELDPETLDSADKSFWAGERVLWRLRRDHEAAAGGEEAGELGSTGKSGSGPILQFYKFTVW